MFNKNSKVFVAYAYFEYNDLNLRKRNLAINNLKYFNELGFDRKNNTTYFLVVNGNQCSVQPSKHWDKVIFRENKGFDFGAWYTALTKINISKYDYFVFLNNTVKGPYDSMNWIDQFCNLITSKNKLTGISMNNLQVPKHIQSMFLCTDLKGLKLIFPSIINTSARNKVEAINKEISTSQKIIKYGYNISPISGRAHTTQTIFVKTEWAKKAFDKKNKLPKERRKRLK